jgi:hypothetical protein
MFGARSGGPAPRGGERGASFSGGSRPCDGGDVWGLERWVGLADTIDKPRATESLVLAARHYGFEIFQFLRSAIVTASGLMNVSTSLAPRHYAASVTKKRLVIACSLALALTACGAPSQPNYNQPPA